MTQAEVQALRHGVYRMHWVEAEGGGSSLAVVGSMHSGRRWFACANWTGKDGKGIPGSDNDESWAKVERAELIEAAYSIAIPRELAERVHGYLLELQDEGPPGVGSKSPELVADLNAIADLLGIPKSLRW